MDEQKRSGSEKQTKPGLLKMWLFVAVVYPRHILAPSGSQLKFYIYMLWTGNIKVGSKDTEDT
jgi:hypothetical protein